MTRDLVDTTTVIDFSKGVEPVSSRLLALIDAGDDVGVCAVVVAEFSSGLAPDQRARWERFFAMLVYWDTPVVAALRAGEDRYTLARQGIQISTADARIAAVARFHDVVIITDTTADFPMPDVRLLSLRHAAPSA